MRKIIFITTVLLLMGIVGYGKERSIREKFQKRKSKNKAYQKSNMRESIIVDGRERTYIIRLPSEDKRKTSLPLVFVLHGGGGFADNAERMSNMTPLAMEEGFIVVYPNGTGKLKNKLLRWNSGYPVGYAYENNIDDVKFFSKLIDKIDNEYNIDLDRVYFTGMSNGARMNYRLACALSDRVAAIAPVAGSLEYRDMKPKKPVSVIIFNGTDDNYVPYDGGVTKDATEKGCTFPSTPVIEAVNFWVKNNGCPIIPRKEEVGNIVRETYSDCKNNTEVILYTIKGGGHSWPGGKEGLKYGNADLPTQEINATNLIWDFFKTHPKNK